MKAGSLDRADTFEHGRALPVTEPLNERDAATITGGTGAPVTPQIEHALSAIPAERLDALGVDAVEGMAQLHHVNLKTTRPEEMIDWYGKALGLQVVARVGGGIWLSNDASNHRLALVTSDALGRELTADDERADHDGLLHTAWEFGSLDHLLTAYTRLKSSSIVPYRTVTHGPTMSFYYEDPDSNQVELQADNFSDWASSRAYMETSEDFRADPFGPDVHPDLMIADREKGVDAEEVVRRAYEGAYSTPEQLQAREERRARSARGEG
jgi:catechol 2,3-dioxygenase